MYVLYTHTHTYNSDFPRLKTQPEFIGFNLCDNRGVCGALSMCLCVLNMMQ